MSNKKIEIGFLEGLCLGAFGTMIILLIIGIFVIPLEPIDELKLDKDKIASYHVLQYYPEYQNCSIEYLHYNKIECDAYINGVIVSCGEVDDRDGMNVLKNSPTLTLCFDEISLEDILDDYISEFKLNEMKKNE